MSNLRLSIIVPMYNVAPYVERCIRSLENQDVPQDEYEIICINDGSPDNCKEIIEELQKAFSNIFLLNQENQGVSMARNNAIAIAKGNYILPIDPDDYVVPNCLKNALEKAEKEQLDVLYCAFEIFDENSKPIWRTNYAHLEQKIDIGYDGYFAVRGIKVKDPDRSWAIFYSSKLIHEFGIEYPKNVPFLEDGLFLGFVLSVSKRVGYSNQDFYQRTIRPGSATNSNLYNTDFARTGFKSAINIAQDFIIKYSIKGLSEQLLKHVQIQFGLKYIISCLNANLKSKAKIFISEGKNLFQDGQTRKNEAFPEKLYMYIISLSPSMFLFTLPILLKLVAYVRNFRPNK
jgi:glycosyltransferase involved in cell wall biosynthesis